MAVLKKIKFGTGTATPIAKTVLTAKSGGVMSVAAPINQVTGEAYTNGVDEDADYQYELDVNVDGTTLVKSTTGEGEQAVTQLAVGTVPAANVSVANGGHNASADPADGKTFVGDDVEEVLLELNEKINQTGNVARTYTVVDDTANVQDLPTNVAKRYRLQETIGSQSPTLVGANIDIPKDSSLKEVYLGASTDTINATTGVITKDTVTDPQSMNFAYQLADGTYSLTKIDVSKFLTESEFGDGLEVSNTGVVSAKLGNGIEFGSEASGNKSLNVKIDSTSETDSASSHASFLSVGANGVKLSGIKDEIDRKIAALDNTSDAAVAGQYITYITEADGIVSAGGRADISGAPLNNYSKGSDATAVAATDTVNQAISKLENQVDAAKSAASSAHSVVAKDANASHLTVTPSTDTTTGAVTYTIGESDIASAQGLANEITRAQTAEGAIDTAVGLTKASDAETRSFTPTTNYGTVGGTAATTVMGNMQNIDTALKNLSNTVGAIQYSVSGTELTFYGMTQHT